MQKIKTKTLEICKSKSIEK